MPPFPESPRCLSPFQGNFFPYTVSTFRTRIDSHNGGTWDSPLGKPLGKATDPLIHAKGTVTLLLQLKKFPDVPVSTREEAREFRPHPEESRFCFLAREEGSFPCLVGKEFPAFPSHLKRRRSPQERRAELQGRTTIPRVPQMSESIPEEHVFPALPRLSSRGSTHTLVAGGTTLWERPLGKL